MLSSTKENKSALVSADTALLSRLRQYRVINGYTITSMQQFIHLSILTLMLTACEINKSDTNNETAKTAVNSIQIFKSILNGNWYQSSYIDSIQETKSPFRSQDALAEMVELDIDTTGMKRDSLEIGAPSIHKGTSFVVYFKPGLTINSLPTNITIYGAENNFF